MQGFSVLEALGDNQYTMILEPRSCSKKQELEFAFGGGKVGVVPGKGK